MLSLQFRTEYHHKMNLQNARSGSQPWISVIVLNYNGQQWLPRCLESLEAQTIFSNIEIIVTDNKSADGSDSFAAEWLERWQKGRVVQNGSNLYYCEANNNGAHVAIGEYLFFLNNDTWLENDCLEKLYWEVKKAGAEAATPLVFNYTDETFQSLGGCGLDVFGMACGYKLLDQTTEIFTAFGAAYYIRADIFKKVGGFDGKLLIYCDETDLSWKVWIAGGKIVCIPAARMHHRGAAVANPAGGTKHMELRTTETKRYLTNRNGLLLLLKNSQHLLLLLLIPHLLLLLCEAFVSLVLIRRWSYVQKSYFDAVVDVFKMRGHIFAWRGKIRSFRRRGDFWMLRFLTWRLNRWGELTQILKLGLPKVEQR
jgi:GT2 family glycosyltransferase